MTRHEDLEKASLDDVRAFYDKWYAPSNATLVLAGDFDKAEAKKLVNKYFGSLRKAPKPERQAVPTPVLSG
ncbi:MAG: insulinase family protein, partial [Actinomycetota bacterium]